MPTRHNCTLNLKTITLTVHCKLASYHLYLVLYKRVHSILISQKPSSSAASRAQLLTVSIQIWCWFGQQQNCNIIEGQKSWCYSLTFTAHINNICQKSHSHIRALRHIRKCLTDDNASVLDSWLVHNVTRSI